MRNRILIVDPVATNKIMLKAKLRQTQYDFSHAADCDEALEILNSKPVKLIIATLDHLSISAKDFCTLLKSDPTINRIPIILIGGQENCDNKIDCLRSGADECFPPKVDRRVLVARARSLIRSFVESEELQMRDGTQRALGFREDIAHFEKREPVLFVGEQTGFQNLSGNSVVQRNTELSYVEPGHVFTHLSASNSQTAFVVNVRADDAQSTMDVLSELRSRKSTWRSVRIALIPEDRPDLAAWALELGANEVVNADASGDEIWLRLSRQIQQKSRIDRLRKTLKSGAQAAVIDDLTGAYNRRYALSHLLNTAQRAKENGEEFSIMVVDIDHFKSVNDRFGHRTGDVVLRQFFERISSNVRAIDLVARIGGEEFLIILPNCKIADAKIAAERLRLAVQKHLFDISEMDITIPVTASFGVAQGNLRCEKETVEDLIARADSAMYSSKNNGRDQVSICTKFVA